MNLLGVIFNRVAGASHAEWIRQAVSAAPSTADVAVLGCLPSDKRLEVKERLLGLLPPASGNGPTASRLAASLPSQLWLSHRCQPPRSLSHRFPSPRCQHARVHAFARR